MQKFKPISHISISPETTLRCCSTLQGAGAFSRDFTTNLTPQGRAFTGALKIEKLKTPLFPGPRGARDTNDWCIICHLASSDVIPLGGVELLSSYLAWYCFISKKHLDHLRSYIHVPGLKTKVQSKADPASVWAYKDFTILIFKPLPSTFLRPLKLYISLKECGSNSYLSVVKLYWN